MDEFKSEDELRPDSSDRRPPRQRKGPAVPKVAMSKQHLMIGIGILVLLLLVISIGSALKAPTHPDNAQPAAGGEKNIDLGAGDNKSAPAAGDPQSGAVTPTPTPQPGGSVTANGANGPSAPQELSAPPVSSTPTQAPISAPNGQQRIELPGNMTDALSNQGDRVNGMSSQMNGNGATSTLPTAPATVAPAGKAPARDAGHTASTPVKAPASVHKAPKQTPMVPSAGTSTSNRTSAPAQAPAAGRAPVFSAPSSAPAPSHSAASSSGGPIQSASSAAYTLQLSSASQPGTLNAYARKQQLGQYWVYETKRDGKAWYVLVSGVYPSLSQAKSAVAQLPADVQAKKPWPRQISQVKQDQNK